MAGSKSSSASPCSGLLLRAVDQDRVSSDRHVTQLYGPGGALVDEAIRTSGARSTLEFRYLFPPDAPTGDWTFRVFECTEPYEPGPICPDTEVPNGEVTVRLEASGSFAELAVTDAVRGQL